MKVLLTHSEGKLLGLEPALNKLKLNIVHQPLIKISFIKSPQTLTKAQEFLNLPWLFFTSQYAIEAWHNLGLPFNTKIALVGQKSAKALAKYSKKAQIIANPQNANGLLKDFFEHKGRTCPVGLVKGNLSLDILETGLNKNHCENKSLIVYQTKLQKITASSNIDIVVLASPSAVKALPKELSKAQLIAIGPSTAQTIQARNWHCLVANKPDINSISKTIEGIL